MRGKDVFVVGVEGDGTVVGVWVEERVVVDRWRL